MLCYAESGLGLHCLPMSHKKDARLIWVKTQFIIVNIFSVDMVFDSLIFCTVLLFMVFLTL